MTPAKVWLVGAGPGDPELLTLKAVRALGEADVVLVDDLVHPDVLGHVPRGARIVHVGKRGGCRSTPQAFIERLMVRLAKSGQTVVRLKGGDPFVFGRGGEEALALAVAGIPCEVVSGVTAGVAAPAAAGVPVTHRGLSRGAILVTGHTADAGDAPDWTLLARTGLTLVVYMGLARVGEIAAALVAGGLAADTPAAAVQDGTAEGQRVVVATVATLAATVRAHDLRSPAILVIGEVAALAQQGAEALDSRVAWSTCSRSHPTVST
jgi:uroporphyrin-III C-methyltransferase